MDYTDFTARKDGQIYQRPFFSFSEKIKRERESGGRDKVSMRLIPASLK